jgi:phage gpG-like protein
MAADIKSRFSSGTAPDGTPWPPIKGRLRGGDKPLLDTGTLRASIWGRPETDGATAGTNDRRAPLLHFGGTVVPKTAQFLSLPLTREAMRSGSPRNFPRPLVVVKSKKGTLLLVEKQPTTKAGKPKKGKKLNPYETALRQKFEPAEAGFIPQYVLLKSVTVPARPFVGVSEAGQAKASAIVVNWAVAEPGESLGGAA